MEKTRINGKGAEVYKSIYRSEMVLGKDPLRDMVQMAQFSDSRLVVFVVLTVVSGASPYKAAHCPATKP